MLCQAPAIHLFALSHQLLSQPVSQPSKLPGQALVLSHLSQPCYSLFPYPRSSAGLAPPPCPIWPAGAAGPWRRPCLPFALPGPTAASPFLRQDALSLLLLPDPNLPQILGEIWLSFSHLVPIALPFPCVRVMWGISAVFVLVDPARLFPAFAAASSLLLVSQPLCRDAQEGAACIPPSLSSVLCLGGWEKKTWENGNNESAKSRFGFSNSACSYPPRTYPLYRMAALAWESLIPFCNSPVSASSLGLPVSAPVVRGKECSPSRRGKGHHGQRGRQASSVLLPPLAEEGNAHQHTDKNRLAYGGNWKKKKRFKRLNILGKALLPFAGQIWMQMQCPGKVQDVCTFHGSLSWRMFAAESAPKNICVSLKVVPGTEVLANCCCSEQLLG